MISKEEAESLDVGDIIEIVNEMPSLTYDEETCVSFGGLEEKLGSRFEIVSNGMYPCSWRAKQVTGTNIKDGFQWSIARAWVVWHSKMVAKKSGDATCPLCGSSGFDLCFAFRCDNKECINSR